jgi:hypothetical protein
MRNEQRQSIYSDVAQERQRFSGVPQAFRQSSRQSSSPLALRSPKSAQSESVVLAVPYLLHWLRSGRNLDFCLLALCSCILTLLCHQTAVLPSSASAKATPSALATSSARSSELDFFLKAALFSTSPKKEGVGDLQDDG